MHRQGHSVWGWRPYTLLLADTNAEKPAVKRRKLDRPAGEFSIRCQQISTVTLGGNFVIDGDETRWASRKEQWPRVAVCFTTRRIVVHETFQRRLNQLLGGLMCKNCHSLNKKTATPCVTKNDLMVQKRTADIPHTSLAPDSGSLCAQPFGRFPTPSSSRVHPSPSRKI